MSRIAILADIHGNVPALEAVVADVGTHRVDEVLVGGDLVGRGPQGSAVIARIAELGWSAVRGNHEHYLMEFRLGRVPDGWRTSEDWACARWMAEELGEAAARWISRLPFSLTPRVDSDLRLVHGTPCSVREGIGPWTSLDVIGVCLDAVAESVLVCGHTHRPLVFRRDGRMAVNVGSVGLPFDGDWRAAYAILEHRRAGWSVTHRRVPYDRDRFLAIYRDSGFLAGGGVTAALLEREVRTARSQLVPFLEWAESGGRPYDRSSLGAFLSWRGLD